jgi:ubiquinone/menaquinone biosynthesis C-methylase UbiE
VTTDIKKALGEAYDRSAAAYDQVAGSIYLRTLWSLLPHVRLGPNPSILDVGCGTGINLLEAARTLAPCQSLTGVDLSPGMLAAARRKAAAAGVKATFAVGDAEALPLADGSVDLVICNSAYHWFPDRSRAVQEMARVLRPGGQVLLATLAQPGYEEWMRVVDEVHRRVFGKPSGTFPEMPTPVEVLAQLRGAGLAVEHMIYKVTPAPVTDVAAFLETMNVVAPVWTGAPQGPAAARIRAETQTAMRAARSFVCTQAGLEAVARKPA